MIVFGFSAVYLVPVFAFLFVLLLLQAIEKIVRKQRCTAEKGWAGLFFALMMWTISVVAMNG